MVDVLSRSDVEKLIQGGIEEGRWVDFENTRVDSRELRAVILALPAGRCKLRIRIRNGFLVGQMSFEGCKLLHPLLFHDCIFGSSSYQGTDAPLILRDAEIELVLLRDCTLHGGVAADRLFAHSGLHIRGSTVTATKNSPASIGLRDARIDRTLDFRETTIDNRSYVAVDNRPPKSSGVELDRAVVGGSLLLDNTILKGNASVSCSGASIGGVLSLRYATWEGSLFMPGAEIKGAVHAEGLHISLARRNRGIAINANSVVVGGDWLMSGVWRQRSERARRTEIYGTVVLAGAKIGGRFAASGVRISSLESDGRGGTALQADYASIGGSFILAGASIQGQLRLIATKVGGFVSLNDARLYNLRRENDVAVNLETAVIGGDLSVRRAKIKGEFRLSRANVSNVALHRAVLYNRHNQEEGVALRANELRVNNLQAFRTVFVGQTVLADAKVEGVLDMERSRYYTSIKKDEGAPALIGRRLAVNGNVVLDRVRFNGNVLLRECKVRGLLSLVGCRLVTLDARDAKVGAHVVFSGAKIVGDVRLNHAEIEGRIDAVNARVHHITLHSANVGGDVLASGIVVGKEGGNSVAIDAERLSVRGDLLFAPTSQHKNRARVYGTIILRRSHIKGSARFDRIILERVAAEAFSANDASIDNSCSFRSARIRGRVSVTSSYVGHRLNFSFCRISDCGRVSVVGFALRAETVDFGGAQIHGGIMLDRATITRALRFQRAELYSQERSNALRTSAPQRAGDYGAPDPLTRERYGRTVLSLIESNTGALDLRTRQWGDEPKGIMDFTRAKTGILEDNCHFWGVRAPSVVSRTLLHIPYVRRLNWINGRRRRGKYILESFAYNTIVNPSGDPAAVPRSRTRVNDTEVARFRAEWLKISDLTAVAERGPAQQTPQPWEHLAKCLTAQGQKEAAEDIYITGRDRYDGQLSFFSGRARGRLLYWLAGYGYSPEWTLGWCCSIIFAFYFLWAAAGALCADRYCVTGGPLVAAAADDYRVKEGQPLEQQYPVFDPVWYSIDIFLPIIDLGYQSVWKPNLRYEMEIALPLPSTGYVQWLALELWRQVKLQNELLACAGDEWEAKGEREVQSCAERVRAALPFVEFAGDKTFAYQLGLGRLLWAAYLLEAVVGAALTAVLIVSLTGLLRGRSWET